MTLTTREPMRRCGRRWATEEQAAHSKLALAGEHFPVPCLYGCGGWHLEKTQTAPRDTGPSAEIRAIVLARDGYACVDCGLSVIGQQYDLQHRDSRGMGGTSDPMANSPVNLLTALRPCHARMERRKAEDNAKGYWLKMGEDPALAGVMYFSPHGSGVLMYLDDEGGISPDAPGEAA